MLHSKADPIEPLPQPNNKGEVTVFIRDIVMACFPSFLSVDKAEAGSRVTVNDMTNVLSFQYPHYFLAIVRFTNSSFSNCPPSILYSFSNSS